MAKRTHLIAAIVFVVNLITTGYFAVSHEQILDDRAQYYVTAVNIYEGETPLMQDRIGLPAMMAAVFYLNGEPTVHGAQALVAVFKAIFAAVFVYFLALFSNTAVVIIASLLFLFISKYHVLGASALTDIPFLTTYWAAVTLMCFSLIQRRPHLLLLAAIPAVVCVTIRFEGVALVGLFAILAFAQWRHGPDKTSFRELLAQYSKPLAVFISFIIATVVVMKMNGLMGGRNKLVSLADWEHWYVLHEFGWFEYIDMVGGYLNTFARRWHNVLGHIHATFKTNGSFFFSGSITYAAAPIILYAVHRAAADEGRVEGAGLIHPQFLWTLMAVVILQVLAQIAMMGWETAGNEFRHGILSGPVVMFSVAAGLAGLGRLVFKSGGPVIFRATSSALILVFVGSFTAAAFADRGWCRSFFFGAPANGPLIQGARWCRDHLPKDAKIFTRKPFRVEYTSGRRAFPIPLTTTKNFVDLGYKLGVEYVLISDREIETRRNICKAIGSKKNKQMFEKLEGNKEFAVYRIHYDKLETGHLRNGHQERKIRKKWGVPQSAFENTAPNFYEPHFVRASLFPNSQEESRELE